MKPIKISGKEAKTSSWNYNPQGKTEDEIWKNGDKVQCKIYPFPELNKTIALAKVEAGAHHGRTVAASDYYYTVLLGRGEFFFYEKEKLTKTVFVTQGDVLIVPEGTDYDYQAQSQDLEVNLLMNNLWEEGE